MPRPFEIVCALLLIPVLGACDRSQALPAPSFIAVPAVSPVRHREPPPPTGSVDATAVMASRIVERHDGFAPIAMTADHGFFMHPGDGKDASLTFDVAGLRQLNLRPRIGDLSTTADCSGSEAGVVRVSWRLDNEPEHSIMVDRQYADQIVIGIGKATSITVRVDEGNGVPLCDWLGLSISDVRND